MNSRLLMVEADSDGDGHIAYVEFVPLAVDLLEVRVPPCTSRRTHPPLPSCRRP